MAVRKSLLVPILVMSGLLAMPAVVSEASTSSEARSIQPSISECINNKKSLDVLFVVDQSKSLYRIKDGPIERSGSDHKHERVPALKAVLSVLNTKTKNVDPDAKVNVTVAHAGFGEGFTLHQEWIKLDEPGFEELNRKFDLQKDLHGEVFTRYHRGLEGALKQFNTRDGDDTACRMLVWFSDGKHDDDNRPDFSKSELNQIERDICGAGGLADQLRSEGIFVIAAGLNKRAEDLALMQLISENQGQMNSPMLSSCGVVDAYGQFQIAEDADALVETLFNLINTSPSGQQINETLGEECADGTPDCSEIRFTVTDAVDSFVMLIDRKKPEVIAELRTGAGARLPLFREGGIRDANAETSLLSTNRLYLEVQRKPNGTITGDWTLRFTGKENKTASALVKFVGSSNLTVEAQIDGRFNSDFDQVDRYASPLVRITARSSDSNIALGTVTAFIRGVSSDGVQIEEELTLQEEEPGVFLVAEDAIAAILQKDQFSRLIFGDLVVRVGGTIPGLLVAETGEPVEVDFPEKSVELRITNGEDWPQFVGQLETPLIKGTDKQKLTLLFEGASARDTTIIFEDNIDENLGMVIVKGQECSIKAGESAECLLELKPAEQSYGPRQFVAKAVFKVTDDDALSQSIDIPIKVDMQKATVVGDGILAAFVLLLAFVGIQGAQRFFFAFLMSRFAVLNPTDRRIRLDVEVSASGNVSLALGTKSGTKPGDESFVFENTEPVSGFPLFGYTFEASAWRTFRHSQSIPKGIASRPGTYVFGSAGTETPKDGSESNGLLSLSLRQQWVVGIEGARMSDLSSGTASVPGEVIAYLEAYERVDQRQQVDDLLSRIAGSDFSEILTTCLERLNPSSPATEDGDGDIFGSMDDPIRDDVFGGISSAPLVAPEKSQRRRRRKAKVSDPQEYSGESMSNSFPNDPFA